MAKRFRCFSMLICMLMTCQATFASSLERFYEMNWIHEESDLESRLQNTRYLEQIYTANEFQLIWYQIQSSESLLHQLTILETAKISPFFESQLKQLREYSHSNLSFEYDLLATDVLLSYLVYAQEARNDGKEWYFGGGMNAPLPQPNELHVSMLQTAIKYDQLPALIREHAPNLSRYPEFNQAYSELTNIKDDVVPIYSQTGLKRVNDLLGYENREILIQRLAMSGIEVDGIERAMEAESLEDAHQIEARLSYYESALETLVKQFQKRHGLKVDGIIGPATMAWLNTSADKRLRILALNAERSRLWPVQREKVILVNVPDFELQFWSDGENVFESKVVVGRKSRKTPLINTKLDSLVLNPSWNVPYKIMVKDILPKMKDDSTYLETNQFEIIKSWTDRSLIDPNEIDWKNINPNTFPYRLRQQPGYRNALGLYKFNTPNVRAIFLHDTPSKHLFNTELRAYSSGCVRVQYADELAATVLETQGIDLNKLYQSQQEERRTSESIRLRERIPVHIIYQTAWVESGVLNYRSDVYNYDLDI